MTGRDDARDAFLARFRWQGGHADVWRAFEDGPALASLVAALAQPWSDAGITRVAGVEARGFLLGGAVAVQLGAGFHAVRKQGALFPGPKTTVLAAPDYRGFAHTLAMQDTLTRDDVVLMVDDWAERGSQARAVRDLVVSSGATFAGLSVIVDQLDPPTRSSLGRVTSIVTAAELGDPGARAQ
jgi:adenine phosphoribosyltransferase